MLLRFLILCLLAAAQWSCHPAPARPLTPLIARDTSIENERNNHLFVFVGEKISVEEQPAEKGSMDAFYLATYKVLLPVYGYYRGDTIQFRVYDHYGRPGFEPYKNVMLFVTEYEGKYYHEKYQYYDVYKTKNGRWASSYKEMEYHHIYNKNTTVKPEKIDFEDEVSYGKTKILDTLAFSPYYKEPYYKFVDDKAIAVYGNYLEDLFRLKKEGVLAARGLFEDKHKDDPIQDVQLEEVTAPPAKKHKRK